MAWNKNLPADSTKLRLSAAIIRANWAAIEEGGVPFDYLQLSEQGSNPTRANDTGWLLGKQEDSQTELFYMDDRNPAVLTQLTRNGRIGIYTQGVNASNFIMDNTSFNFAKNQMIIAMGHVTSGGNLNFGVNIDSATQTDTGRYTINVKANALLTANYLVIATTNRSGAGNSRWIMVIDKPTPVAATPTVIEFQTRSNSDSATNSSFDVIIIGGR